MNSEDWVEGAEGCVVINRNSQFQYLSKQRHYYKNIKDSLTKMFKQSFTVLKLATGNNHELNDS